MPLRDWLRSCAKSSLPHLPFDKNIMYDITPIHTTRGCLSYIVSDPETKEAALIDPSQEAGPDTYADILREKNLTLRYILETHTHADHISSARELREALGGKIAMHAASPLPSKDIPLEDGMILPLGGGTIEVLATPGHTDESVTYRVPGAVFTGDALLIGGTGRTDFQRGDSAALYESLWQKLMRLPEDTIVHPAHNYEGRTASTIGEEKRENPRLKLEKEEFIATLDAHHPPLPDLFDTAVPKNSH